MGSPLLLAGRRHLGRLHMGLLMSQWFPLVAIAAMVLAALATASGMGGVGRTMADTLGFRVAGLCIVGFNLLAWWLITDVPQHEAVEYHAKSKERVKIRLFAALHAGASLGQALVVLLAPSAYADVGRPLEIVYRIAGGLAFYAGLRYMVHIASATGDAATTNHAVRAFLHYRAMFVVAIAAFLVVAVCVAVLPPMVNQWVLLLAFFVLMVQTARAFISIARSASRLRRKVRSLQMLARHLTDRSKASPWQG